MFDTELVYSSLKQIQRAVELIIERSETVNNVDDFLTSPGGVLRLDALCMNLIALGEAVKGLDKLTDGQLLPKFPEVYWQGIMKMRDKIAHLPKAKLPSKRLMGGIDGFGLPDIAKNSAFICFLLKSTYLCTRQYNYVLLMPEINSKLTLLCRK